MPFSGRTRESHGDSLFLPLAGIPWMCPQQRPFPSLAVIYVPALNTVFWTAAVLGIAWTLNVGFALMVFPYTETVKKMARDNPDGFAAEHVVW